MPSPWPTDLPRVMSHPSEPPTRDEGADFAAAVQRVAGRCALVYALVNPIALALRAEFADRPSPGHRP
jgi:hypothetical protein